MNKAQLSFIDEIIVDNFAGGGGASKAFLKAVNVIKTQPAAVNVAEVKHGEWLDNGTYKGWTTSRCSCCGLEVAVKAGDDLGYNYCPKCGAKMGGE